MVIIRDLAGNIIGKEASAHYTPTRVLRNRHEQALCDKQMGIERAPSANQSAQDITPEAKAEAEFEARFIAQINHAEHP